jgi:hypothetical protein
MKIFKSLVIFSLFLSGCNFKPKDKVVPQWEMDFLGPLVKTDLSVQNIANIENLHASKSFSLSDFGISLPTNTPVIIPAISAPMNLGPYSLDFSDAFGTADFESGNLYFVVTNQLEMDVKSGTKILINDGGTNLLTDNLPADIAPYNGTHTSPTIDLSNKTVSSKLSLQIKNFTSDGSRGSFVTIDPNRKLIIDVFINNVKVKSISVTSSNQFTIADTSDFSITGTKVKAKSVTGVITTYVSNQFPFDMKFQVYFLDQSKTIKIDSLFDTPVIISKSVGGVTEAKFVTTINETKTNNLNNSSYARSVVTLNTGSTVTIPNTYTIHGQLVGDLQLKLDQQ